MKGKFIIIGALLLLLAFTVYQMLKYEDQTRQERVVREYIEDESKPLIEKFDIRKLQAMAPSIDYYFRAEQDYFSYLAYGPATRDLQWQPFLMKGVNLGVALPGSFPGEFTMSYGQYFEWLKQIGEMNANVVRVYTILPPAFYTAFAQYNLLHQNKPLYLVQGVWATVPASENYLDNEYTQDFRREIRDALDVLHGRAVLQPRRGKASGVYATDISKYVSAILLGREWEPNMVHITNQKNANRQYDGDFVSLNDGNAMEAWLAEMMDFCVRYETQQYRMQHPLSFVNWLPLDPMFHNTEIIESDKVREYDNDLAHVDFNRFHSTPLFVPGIYASYHAYPYYPDFIYLEEQYRTFRNASGQTDNFAGYLHHLKAQHPGMPLIISEYGLPSSRGNSHQTPLGLDQGGHNEKEHAQKNLLLTRDIFEAGAAGAIFFEWADEWFKHNWLVMDFEQPFEDRKLWHNLENPEQNFGILALESREKTMDGSLEDWEEKFKTAKDFSYAQAADPGYFYLALQLPGFDFQHNHLYLALDVLGKKKGDHRLPFTDTYFENGFEFLLEFIHPDSAQILVDEPYSVYTDIYNDSVPVYASKENENGLFVAQALLSNRGRSSLLGERVDSMVFVRSRLVHGNSSLPEYSHADWFWDATTNLLELRLTWHLLNVSDPAKRYVLDDVAGTPEIEYSKTEAFRGWVFITDTSDQVQSQHPLQLSWEEWDVPDYRSRLKPLYDSLREYFRAVEPTAPSPVERKEGKQLSLCDFYGDKKGAVSFRFERGSYSQFEYAAPVLAKYQVSGTFRVSEENQVPSPMVSERDEAGRRKRLSEKELRALEGQGHELVFLPARAKAKQMVGAKLHPHRTTASALSPAELMKHFEKGKADWHLLSYYYFYEEGAWPKSGKMPDSLFIPQRTFDQHVRLARNQGYWLATEGEVWKYLAEREASHIEMTQHRDLLIMVIQNELDKTLYDVPLSVKLKTDAAYVQVTGSASDGTYTNRMGEVIFQAVPGKEITLRLIR